MSRPAPTRKELTRDRIVDMAAKAIRRRGYAGVGVADVMKDAGLTHGGFYAHFESRDALLVAALERAGQESVTQLREARERHAGRGYSPFRSLVESYLADSLLSKLDAGCPVAALGCDMPRQSEPVRAASALRVRRLIAGVQAALPGASPGTAGTVAATLAGTLQLARALGDNEEGRELLAATREALIAQHDAAPALAPAAPGRTPRRPAA